MHLWRAAQVSFPATRFFTLERLLWSPFTEWHTMHRRWKSRELSAFHCNNEIWRFQPPRPGDKMCWGPSLSMTMHEPFSTWPPESGDPLGDLRPSLGQILVRYIRAWHACCQINHLWHHAQVPDTPKITLQNSTQEHSIGMGILIYNQHRVLPSVCTSVFLW